MKILKANINSMFKQTCTTYLTMELEFVVLLLISKEVKWLRNVLHDILLWLKPVTIVCMCCDDMTTQARAKTNIYNGKLRP